MKLSSYIAHLLGKKDAEGKKRDEEPADGDHFQVTPSPWASAGRQEQMQNRHEMQMKAHGRKP